MKMEPKKIFRILLIILLLLSLTSCRRDREPAPPEISQEQADGEELPTPPPTVEDTPPPTEDILSTTGTCQGLGGIDCTYCCKEPITEASDTGLLGACCEANSCIERIQTSTTFEELGEVTIELFPTEDIGVWYGEVDEEFGVRSYINAQNIEGNEYSFVIDEKEFSFTLTESTCNIGIPDFGYYEAVAEEPEPMEFVYNNIVDIHIGVNVL